MRSKNRNPISTTTVRVGSAVMDCSPPSRYDRFTIIALCCLSLPNRENSHALFITCPTQCTREWTTQRTGLENTAEDAVWYPLNHYPPLNVRIRNMDAISPATRSVWGSIATAYPPFRYDCPVNLSPLNSGPLETIPPGSFPTVIGQQLQSSGETDLSEGEKSPDPGHSEHGRETNT